MPATWPAYLELYESGELERRTHEAVASLESCRVYPRNCKVDRLKNEEIDRRPRRDEMIAARRLFREAGLTRLDERAVRLPRFR